MDLSNILNELSKIDYANLLLYLLPTFTYIISEKMYEKHRKFSLIKHKKPVEIKQVCIPPSLKTNKKGINVKNVLSKTLGDEILNFSNVIINNFNSDDLKIFYHNINKVRIGYSENLYEDKVRKLGGLYLIGPNTITIDKQNSKQVLYHELFHMASTIKQSDIYYSGFEQDNLKGYQIGRGLNEGYTELLTTRYFKGNKNSAYKYEMHIASKLEEIIGQEQMESYYLKSDLHNLVEDLKKYAKEHEIIEFLKELDYYSKHNRLGYKPNDINKERIEKSLKKINEYILKFYLMKVKSELERKKIDKQEAVKKANIYINGLGRSITESRYNTTYNYLSVDRLNEILSEIFEKTEDIDVETESKQR